MIQKLSRQGPASNQGDAHRTEVLLRAVIVFPWSHEPLSRVATHCLNFQQVYGELEAGNQLCKESNLATMRDAAIRGRGEDLSRVMYAGKARYGTRRTSVISAPLGSTPQKQHPLSISVCFNCDDPHHMLRDFPLPRNTSKAATRNREYFNKKKASNGVHMVLVEVFHQLN